MAVTLSPLEIKLEREAVARSTVFDRYLVLDAEGRQVPVFEVTITYVIQDWETRDGAKVSLFRESEPISIRLSPEEVMTLGLQKPDKPLLEALAGMIDQMIHSHITVTPGGSPSV